MCVQRHRRRGNGEFSVGQRNLHRRRISIFRTKRFVQSSSNANHQNTLLLGDSSNNGAAETKSVFTCLQRAPILSRLGKNGKNRSNYAVSIEKRTDQIAAIPNFPNAIATQPLGQSGCRKQQQNSNLPKGPPCTASKIQGPM